MVILKNTFSLQEQEEFNYVYLYTTIAWSIYSMLRQSAINWKKEHWRQNFNTIFCWHTYV